MVWTSGCPQSEFLPWGETFSDYHALQKAASTSISFNLAILSDCLRRRFKLISFSLQFAAFAEAQRLTMAPKPEASMELTLVKSSTTVSLCENSRLTVVPSDWAVSDVILPVQWTVVLVGVHPSRLPAPMSAWIALRM